MEKYNHFDETWEDSLEPLKGYIQDSVSRLSENKVIFSLRITIVVVRAVKRFSNAWLKKKSVSAAGCGLLHSLVVSGGRMTPTQIGKQLMLDKCFVTKIVNNLEKQELIVREPLGYDSRTRDVVITQKGIDLVNERSDYFQRHMVPSILAELDKKQTEELIVLLQLIKNIDFEEIAGIIGKR